MWVNLSPGGGNRSGARYDLDIPRDSPLPWGRVRVGLHAKSAILRIEPAGAAAYTDQGQAFIRDAHPVHYRLLCLEQEPPCLSEYPTISR